MKPFPLPLLSSCPPPPSLQTLAKCWVGTGIAVTVSCCVVEGVPFVERMKLCLHWLPFLGIEEERGKDTQSPQNEGGAISATLDFSLESSWSVSARDSQHHCWLPLASNWDCYKHRTGNWNEPGGRSPGSWLGPQSLTGRAVHLFSQKCPPCCCGLSSSSSPCLLLWSSWSGEGRNG